MDNINEQEKSAGHPISTKPKRLDFQKNPKLTLILGLVLALLIATTYALITRDTDSSFETNYRTVEKAVAPGKGNMGGRISFNKPSELEKVFEGATAASSRNVYIQLAKSSKSDAMVEISNLLARAQNLQGEGAPAAGYTDTLRNNLNNTQSADYKFAVKPIESSVDELYKNSQQTTLGSAKTFTNPNVTKDAWQFDVTASGDEGKGVPQQKGTAVVMIGKGGIYYFVVSATTNNWNNQQQFFKNILDSIQIDQ